MKHGLFAFLVAVGILWFGTSLPGVSAETTGLQYRESCIPDGIVEVTFSWTGNEPSALQQWLDLSLFDNGWQTGTFLNAGPLSSQQQTLTWRGLIANTTHFVRLNQLLPGGSWDPSPTFHFTTRSCPLDSEERVRVLAPIESTEFVPGQLPGSYLLYARAGLPGGCARPDGFEVSQSGSDITVSIFNTVPAGPVVCTLIYGIYDVSVDLGPNLIPGQGHNVHVNGGLHLRLQVR